MRLGQLDGSDSVDDTAGEHDAVLAAQDTERVPPGERARPGAVAEWTGADRMRNDRMFTQADDLGQNGFPVARRQALQVFDEDVTEDDLGLIAGEALPGPHWLPAVAARCGSLIRFATKVDADKVGEHAFLAMVTTSTTTHRRNDVVVVAPAAAFVP